MNPTRKRRSQRKRTVETLTTRARRFTRRQQRLRDYATLQATL